jgi:hypothetical protein
MSQPQRHVAAPTKSVGAAVALTLFFGPFGMFYATVGGAVVMLILYVVIGILTLGFGLLFLWPITVIWAAMAVQSHNQGLWQQHSGPTSVQQAGVQASRECPFCRQSIRRDASVCAHCRRESEPWVLHEGFWWTKGTDGNQYWLNERTMAWERHQALSAERPSQTG